MFTGYQIRHQAKLNYLDIQVVDWIDVFTRQAYPDVANATPIGGFPRSQKSI